MTFSASFHPTPELLAMLGECERRIGVTFADKSLLYAALVHASSADHRLASNERLEFLGDAILGAVVCEMLFWRYPEYLEGELTQIKSSVVSRQTCAKAGEALGLEEFLILGKGMSSHATVPSSLVAGAYESLVAAIHLDVGAEAAKEFIERSMGPEIELAVAGESERNYKSMLQQVAQRDFGATPGYHLLDEKGPDHSKCFKVAAHVGEVRYPPAWGRNKKEAEQRAACNALCQIRGEEPTFAAE